MRKYSELEIKEKVKIALGMLLENDAFLLEHDVNERSISHKLAEYLQQLFPDYHVDCEYNWQIDDPYNKEIFLTPEEERYFYPKTNEEKIKDQNAHTVYPDIIIHRRGHNEDNLLIIEMKKTSNKDERARERDKLKLGKYKDKFDYEYILLLDIPTNGEFNLKAYRDIDTKLNGKE